MNKKHEEFARKIIKIRDSQYKQYLDFKNFVITLNVGAYENTLGSLVDPARSTLIEKFKFIKSLNETQLKQIDKVILGQIDNQMFEFLREIEEGYSGCGGSHFINILDVEKCKELSKDFLSGTFFGEYFLWCQNLSEFGEFQY